MKRARRLRHNATRAEIVLWEGLRKKGLDGARFRRQHPIGPYIVDFFCPERKLVIEVDGKGHMMRTREDMEKDEFLTSCGYRVFRFWNDEVLGNRPAVLERIRAASWPAT